MVVVANIHNAKKNTASASKRGSHAVVIANAQIVTMKLINTNKDLINNSLVTTFTLVKHNTAGSLHNETNYKI